MQEVVTAERVQIQLFPSSLVVKLYKFWDILFLLKSRRQQWREKVEPGRNQPEKLIQLQRHRGVLIETFNFNGFWMALHHFLFVFLDLNTREPVCLTHNHFKSSFHSTQKEESLSFLRKNIGINTWQKKRGGKRHTLFSAGKIMSPLI